MTLAAEPPDDEYRDCCTLQPTGHLSPLLRALSGIHNGDAGAHGHPGGKPT
jgi:hypothetical protein